jgi:hypothetical protein
MKLTSFTAIVTALDAAQVRYLVAGGLAVSSFGATRIKKHLAYASSWRRAPLPYGKKAPTPGRTKDASSCHPFAMVTPRLHIDRKVVKETSTGRFQTLRSANLHSGKVPDLT